MASAEMAFPYPNCIRGAEGERITRAALAALPQDEWRVRHGLAVNSMRCDIDHVAIGPAGVFAIDTKNWTNPVRLSGDALWDKRRRIVHFDGLEAGANQLQHVLGVSVTRMACFVAQAPGICGAVRGVKLVSPDTVVDALLQHPARYQPELVAAFDAVIRRTFPPARWSMRIERRRNDRYYLVCDETGAVRGEWSAHNGFGADPEPEVRAVIGRKFPQQGVLPLL